MTMIIFQFVMRAYLLHRINFNNKMKLFRNTLVIVSLTFLSFSAYPKNIIECVYSPDKPAYEVKDETIREKIIIDIKNNEEWEYMIFNTDGSCLRMGLLEKGKNKISLKDMCKGEYFVYLSNGTKRYMEKVKQ